MRSFKANPASSTATQSLTDPTTRTTTTSSSPPPSPSHTSVKDEAAPPAQESSDRLADLPPLLTSLATTKDDRIEALHLIADSVAQQRQVAAKHLISHPIVVGLAAILIGIAANFLYAGSPGALPILLTTGAGCIMAILIAVKWATGEYIEHAERVGTWVWLVQESDDDNSKREGEEILITKYGDEIIGALVLRIERDTTPVSSPQTSSRNSRSSKRKQLATSSRTGVIRAWTVKRRYRQRGIGTELLEEAVTLCRTRQLHGPVFSDQHANSKRVLPALFNDVFDRREQRARSLLDKVIAESESAS
jgi:ribosomal protein S18 acetylase RimI-like enzyme